jgi:glycosyltransferase involved in cell wall biosynthesis
MSRVSLAFLRHSHHADWSGYPRIADHLSGLVPLRLVEPIRAPRRVMRHVAEPVGEAWYGAPEAALDLAAARRLMVGRDEVVHVLYPEHGHRFACRVPTRLRGRRTRLVVTMHHPPAFLAAHPPPAAVYEGVDHAIALGPAAAAYLAGVLGSDRVSCAFLGVDTDAWSPGAARAPEPTCAFVGTWLRDLDVLEQVVGAVRAQRPDVRFEAISSPRNVRRLAAVPGVEARAGIPDAELRDLYRRSWLHVLPFAAAVSSNALLEGMACGLATVTTAIGDVESYTADAAALSARGDAEAMAQTVLDLLGDERRREVMARHARARAEELSLGAAARRHAEIYARVASAARR